METVKEHTDEKWVLMYIERWLKAPIVKRDGTSKQRQRHTTGRRNKPTVSKYFLGQGI